MPPRARLVIAVLIGVSATASAAASAWAEGCCLLVRPAPATPTLRLDAVAPESRVGVPRTLANGFDPVRPGATGLPFLPLVPGTAQAVGPGATLTFTAPVAAGEGQVSLSLGIRSGEAAPAGRLPFAPLP